MFLSSSAAERVAWKEEGRARGEREGERDRERESARREGSSLRRVGNWPKVCKSETRGTKIGKEGRELFSLRKKKATTFISALCPTVDQ